MPCPIVAFLDPLSHNNLRFAAGLVSGVVRNCSSRDSSVVSGDKSINSSKLRRKVSPCPYSVKKFSSSSALSRMPNIVSSNCRNRLKEQSG